ncbi:universal stress protein [Pseudonocardia sp. RS11V-5]|uniref:universal stress protein n=1 Tax=Pseudonocardia terrae TaxID=2905831 RepID=UPI001E52BD0A|nr:universal stress protein [Pseudonocardia terrae]MCE3555159.1 universal stress protein [Pseudonocardia terrae]
MGAPTIVVGVDGSAGSRTALEHALRDAARRGARVRVVMAFEAPDHWPDFDRAAAPPTPAEIIDRIESGLGEAVVAARAALSAADARVRDVPVDVLALPGSPAAVLLAQAEDADDLVVGHRGRGGLASALLGSVGLQCVLHAPCRVTVVRPPRTAQFSAGTTRVVGRTP